MGILDRDWYRDELRRRQGLTPDGHRGRPPKEIQHIFQHQAPARIRFRWGKMIFLLALMAGLALAVHDMNERGVQFTWRGLRWWLSLWVDP